MKTMRNAGDSGTISKGFVIWGKKASTMSLVFAVLAASIVGTVLLRGSQAATPFISAEAEAGSVMSPASLQADPTASGGSAIKFAQTTTPTGWPDTTNTGIAGCPALTTVNGDIRPGNGEVVENKLVKGQILINYAGAKNITLRCVKSLNYPSYFPIDLERPGTTSPTDILFDHVEVDCVGSQVAHTAMLLMGVTVKNSRVYGCTDGFRLLDNVTIESSLCSGLRVNGDANNTWHYDCSQSTGGSNITLRGNYFKSRDTSDILLKSDLKAINNVLVENNLFDGDADLGPSYMVYSVDGGYGVPTNVRFLNNRFTRNYTYGPCSFHEPIPTWTNNVWHDTGVAFTPAQAAGCIGR